MPCLASWGVEEDKILRICVLQEKINSSLKYIKAYLLGDSVWLFYERQLMGEEDLETVIPRMILHLEAGLEFARKSMAELEEPMEGGSADDEPEEAEEVVDEESRDNDNDNNE